MAELRRRAPQQAKLYRFIADQSSRDGFVKAELCKRLKVSTAAVSGLVKKELLREFQGRLEREAYNDGIAGGEHVQAVAHALNAEQQAAADSLIKSLSDGCYRTHLLQGVTGSGKTEVYLQVLRAALQNEGGAIFLVPEVALTPQTVARLRARLEQESGVKVVVWHSHLSDGERYDAWYALATGAARVVVGARSAIFAPVRNLRLIVVDEEHEPAFKQEESPRYHGRDVAVYRSFLQRCLCVLGSATPSLESVHNASIGKYRLNVMRQRVVDRQLPIMHVVDMKREVRGKGQKSGVFSRFLLDRLQERLERKEQSILFINRRGYDASLNCQQCGHVEMCEHCAVSMTHHKAEGLLRCHMCGAERAVPRHCPQCQSPDIHYKGSGTQKVEDIATKLLPKARIVRIDADTMQKRHLFRTVLDEFRKGKIDILVGTQMIAKGLDFPNVTLVGLIDADISLHLPDFRASERTFQLLVQVAGRAGRGDQPGEVVVQTFLPYAPPVQFARRQDFDDFALEELELRKQFGYPPYRHIIHHIIRGTNEDKVVWYSEQWVKFIEPRLQASFPGIEIRGPAPCPIPKIKNLYRFQVWYFTDNVSRLVAELQQLRSQFQWDPNLANVLDVDAVNLI
ncbi:MAG: primosomal protein N' [Verrucomicrobia bacterium]|nr:primosomal protein N' [Verrucomicrobiota bacterium]